MTRKRLKLFVGLTLAFWAVGFLTGICGRCVEPGTWRCECVPFEAVAPAWVTLPLRIVLAYGMAWALTRRTGGPGTPAA